MRHETSQERGFAWSGLGDIDSGRANLGPDLPVWAYRLMQYTFRDALLARLGNEAASEIIVAAGRAAGMAFCRNMMPADLDFQRFIAKLQQVLQRERIGILRVEKADLHAMSFTLTVAEDLDCSGLPFSGEVVCQYDEGFIAGILEEYTGEPFDAREIDCWASGDRVCRFDVTRKESGK